MSTMAFYFILRNQTQKESKSCPTLWLVDSENEFAMASISEYEEEVKSSKVQVEVIGGLNHLEEFSEIERSLPLMLAFTTGEPV